MTYRLRVGNLASLVPLNLALEGHNMTVIAADSNHVEPFTVGVEGLDTYTGQTYDVVFTADQVWHGTTPEHSDSDADGITAPYERCIPHSSASSCSENSAVQPAQMERMQGTLARHSSPEARPLWNPGRHYS